MPETLRTPNPETPRTVSRPRWRWPRWLPPARLAWIALAALGAYGSFDLLGLGVTTLIALPLIAAIMDLAFQAVRFSHVRFPDAALATGLFLALILPPTAPILLAGTLAFAAVAVRHVLRAAGRPWFNPAATAIVLGTVLFGLAPAWWVGIGPYGLPLLIALGVLLLVRTPSSWRMPAVFLIAYGFLSVVQHLVVGASTDPRILLLGVADPATLFFALFMLPEPRTSPPAAHQMVLFAGIVGSIAAFLPLFLPSLGVLVALLGGNLLAVLLRWSPSESLDRIRSGVSSSGRRATRPRTGSERRRARGAASRSRWPLSYRVGAGVAVLVVLAAVAGANPLSVTPSPVVKVTCPGGSGGSGGGGSGVAAACQKDNPSIPSSDLSTLHKVLGPSVILSYDSSTGVVRFYDPANHETVTETDLYEDYGFAEFNGDDYAVSGCAP